MWLDAIPKGESRYSMDLSTSVKLLKRFNQQADKLARLTFTKQVLAGQSGVRFSMRQGIGSTTQRYGPDDESIAAFVLTFRLFVQDKDSISIRNITALLQSLPITSVVKSTAVEIRSAINQFLDSDTPYGYNGEQLTFRRIYEVFLWGYLCHIDDDKYAVYDAWSSFAPVFPMLENEFVFALSRVLLGIMGLKRCISDALAELPDSA